MDIDAENNLKRGAESQLQPAQQLPELALDHLRRNPPPPPSWTAAEGRLTTIFHHDLALPSCPPDYFSAARWMHLDFSLLANNPDTLEFALNAHNIIEQTATDEPE